MVEKILQTLEHMSTVKNYISSAEKGDVNTMVSLYSSKEIQKTGMEKLRSGDQLFSDLVKKTIARGEILQMTLTSWAEVAPRVHSVTRGMPVHNRLIERTDLFAHYCGERRRVGRRSHLDVHL